MSRVTSGVAVILTSTLAIFSPWAAIGAPRAETVITGQTSVTEDLSQGRTFTFSIDPKLSPFVFKLVPQVQPNDQYGNFQSTIRAIEVFRGDSKAAFQHLTGCNLEEMEPPGSGSEFFVAEDINFDGYNDIFLKTMWGATGNESGCVWLYNSAAGQFEYSKAFSDLAGFSLEPATKTITTFSRGGMAGYVHNAARFAVQNNLPVLKWSETQDWDDSKKQFHCVVRERRGKDLVIVRDVWGGGGEDDAPCDPSALFR